MEDTDANHNALCAFILGYITAEVQTLSMMASSRTEPAHAGWETIPVVRLVQKNK